MMIRDQASKTHIVDRKGIFGWNIQQTPSIYEYLLAENERNVSCFIVHPNSFLKNTETRGCQYNTVGKRL